MRIPHLRVSVGITIFAGGDFLWRCLDSVAASAGYDQLILVFDGSDADLPPRLREWARRVGAEFHCHDRTLGYTASANQILLAATGDVVVLLNSDTVVPRGWIDRLIVPFGDPRTGLAGPWSNAATAQSIPEIPAMAGYAANDLPDDVDVEAVNAALAAVRIPDSPPIPAVNGFCLAIRRDLIQAIGTFDGIAFAEGFGEELDYALRAAAAGFSARVADTLYVHHVKSQSFGVERRQQLSARGKDILRRLHGDEEITRLLAALRRWSETSPQRIAAATLLRRVSGGMAPAIPGIRIGVFSDGNGGAGFRGVTGIAAAAAGSPPFALGAAIEAPSVFDLLVICSWTDLAPAAALAGDQAIIHLATSRQSIEDALGDPVARSALGDSGIAGHFCLDAETAGLLLRNFAIRAVVLPEASAAARTVPTLLIVHADAEGAIDGAGLAAALAADPRLATTLVDPGATTPREIDRAIRAADYCLDLRPAQAGWRGALRAFRLGAIPLLLTDDGLGEIVEAEVGEIVLPAADGIAGLAAAIAVTVAAGAGSALGTASRQARPRLPAGWLNAFAAGVAPTLRRAAPARLAAAE
ncbi:MAG: glycosyltransferase family 2 protein [Bauldia sp.]|nr:glycosyltransferase family 2 protein [Bauldia sp.]